MPGQLIGAPAHKITACHADVVAWIVCLMLLCLTPLVVADATAQVDPEFAYLYIDANEDQASGGHAAVRIDADVFHFQFSDGLLAMSRDRWDDFQLSYRGFQNRTIHSTQLAITPLTHALLRAAFVRRYVTQSAQLQRVAQARADQQLLDVLLDPAGPAPNLPGLGFFLPAASGPEAAGAADMTDFSALCRAIAQRYGERFLVRQREALETQLLELEVRALSVRAEDFQPGVLPRPDYPFNQRYADLVLAIRAIDVLLGGWRFDPRRLELAMLAPASYALDAQERALIEQVSAQLAQRLVRLAGSTRPDRGGPLVLGLARLETLRLSLRHGRWMFDDVLQGDSVSLQVGSGVRDNLPGLKADARALAQRAKQAWLEEPQWNEQRYAELEIRAVNEWELLRVGEGAEYWRVRDKEGIALGQGALLDAPRPTAIFADPAGLMQGMREALTRAERFAEQEMGYRLLERNCVSELFVTIGQAMAAGVSARGDALNDASMGREWVLRLGGVVDPSPVPFYSSRQVRKRWRVAAERELPSLRRLYTADQYRQHRSLVVLLRESNALTGRAQDSGCDDLRCDLPPRIEVATDGTSEERLRRDCLGRRLCGHRRGIRSDCSGSPDTHGQQRRVGRPVHPAGVHADQGDVGLGPRDPRDEPASAAGSEAGRPRRPRVRPDHEAQGRQGAAVSAGQDSQRGG